MHTRSSPILSLQSLNSSRPRRTLPSSLHLGNKCHYNRGLAFKILAASVCMSSPRRWMLVLRRERLRPPSHSTLVYLRKPPTKGLKRFQQNNVDIRLAHICRQKASRSISTTGNSRWDVGKYFPSPLMNPHIPENSMSVYSFYPVASI